MKKTMHDTRYMATLAMLCGVLLVMGMTGIGFIPLPVIKATTMHIPVILGAVLLGPKAGAVLGCVFGLCSVWANTTTPGLLSFAFSPFMTNEGFIGAVKSLWIAVGCRTLFGYLAGWIYQGANRLLKKDYLATQNESRERTEGDIKKGLLYRFGNNVLRLIAPLL